MIQIDQNNSDKINYKLYYVQLFNRPTFRIKIGWFKKSILKQYNFYSQDHNTVTLQLTLPFHFVFTVQLPKTKRIKQAIRPIINII